MVIEKVEAASTINHLEQHSPKGSGGWETVVATCSKEGCPGFPLFLGPDQP